MISEDSEAIKNFREYLRIPSIHPDVNYGKNLLKHLLIFETVFDR